MTNSGLPLESWRDAHPLEGVVLKMRRARKHLDTVNEYFDKYDALSPQRLNRTLNVRKSRFEYRLESRFPPFLDFGIAIGEFAYQLRSTLDQLIFALSVFPTNLSDSDLHKAERSSSFPILLERNDPRLKAQMKYVPAAIFADLWRIVDDFQPYQRENAAEKDNLAILEEINIRDKHRFLRPVGNLIRFENADLADGIELLVTDTVAHDDVFAYVPSHLDPEIEFEPRVKTEIKIEIPRPTGGVPLSILGPIYSTVCGGIFPRFTTFFGPFPETVQKKIDALFD